MKNDHDTFETVDAEQLAQVSGGSKTEAQCKPERPNPSLPSSPRGDVPKPPKTFLPRTSAPWRT